MHYKPVKDKNGELILKVRRGGQHLIHDPLLNKGTAFTGEERELFGLVGILPPQVVTIDKQISRLKENYDHKPDNIEKYIFLRALQDRNETLFYAFVREYITETLPIIYTPTVGEAVEKHGHIYRDARGLFISPENVDRMDEMATQLPSREIEVIVVTDSQGILGIGDQGVGGMAIPIGKLSLYTVAAGIHPASCLPICLDVGTDNQTLLADEYYLGHRRNRLTGDAYRNFIENFVEGVKRNFPDAILQWEDFSKQNAFTNMDSYMKVHRSFNDDIQGTGAVTLGGIITALKINGGKLGEQKFAIYGAGAAGIGIARQIKDALLHEGLPEDETRCAMFVVDSKGLIVSDRENLDEYKKEFAYPEERLVSWKRDNVYQFTLADVLKNGKVTVLIGVSAQKGSIDSNVVDIMLENCKRPVIFPLSNPTSKAEADPRWILEYTEGKAIVASGSPFSPVTVGGREFHIGQGNNAFIFPGVGLGAIASGAKEIGPSLFTAAAHALAGTVSEERMKSGSVYPPIEELFVVSLKVAAAVYREAVESGVGVGFVDGHENLDEKIGSLMWLPAYPRYIAK
jgi:malate dehydrogenase (oxaloacetate-decarboxylating)